MSCNPLEVDQNHPFRRNVALSGTPQIGIGDPGFGIESSKREIVSWPQRTSIIPAILPLQICKGYRSTNAVCPNGTECSLDEMEGYAQDGIRVNRGSSGEISERSDMRSRLAISLIRSLCAAACCALLALQAEAFDSKKPLTEYTHTVWTHRDDIPPRSFTRLRRLGTVTFGSPRRMDLSDLTASALSIGVPRRAIRSSLVRSLCPARDGSLWVGTDVGLVGHIRGDDLKTFSVGRKRKQSWRIGMARFGLPPRIVSCDSVQ